MNRQPEFSPLERLHVTRPVRRVEYVAQSCTGLTVLDLGAMDETAFRSKRGSGHWLHEELSRCAKRVVGIDNSSAVPPEGLKSFPNATIIHGDVYGLEDCLNISGILPDVVVAGELIEHLEHPLRFLRGIKSEGRLSGKKLILTTPNATALPNCLIALLGIL